MTNCRQSSELSSQSLDRKLSLRQWLALKLHTAACPFCKRFGEHIAMLKNFCEKFGECGHEKQITNGLTPEARKRMKESLRGTAGK
ncbi:zf-HC2 domain-containing protein [bacterium]|nr:zf-HC2 domain-containing protein [bacterium]